MDLAVFRFLTDREVRDLRKLFQDLYREGVVPRQTEGPPIFQHDLLHTDLRLPGTVKAGQLDDISAPSWLHVIGLAADHRPLRLKPGVVFAGKPKDHGLAPVEPIRLGAVLCLRPQAAEGELVVDTEPDLFDQSQAPCVVPSRRQVAGGPVVAG